MPLASFPQLINFEESLLIRLSSWRKPETIYAGGTFLEEEARIQFLDETQRNTQVIAVEIIENETVIFVGKFCLYTSHTQYSETLSTSRLSVRLSRQFQQKFCPRSVGLHFHLPSGRHPQVATCPLTCHPRNSWCCHRSGLGLLKKKNFFLLPQAVGEQRRPQCLITPSHDSTHQDSNSNKSISL